LPELTKSSFNPFNSQKQQLPMLPKQQPSPQPYNPYSYDRNDQQALPVPQPNPYSYNSQEQKVLPVPQVKPITFLVSIVPHVDDQDHQHGEDVSPNQQYKNYYVLNKPQAQRTQSLPQQINPYAAAAAAYRPTPQNQNMLPTQQRNPWKMPPSGSLSSFYKMRRNSPVSKFLL